MGGIGSGRPSRFPATVESTKRIDIRYMRRQGLLRTGSFGTLHWSRNGEYTGSINYRLETGSLILRFRFRSHSGDNAWKDAEQHISLSETACHFGGTRKWFHCPRCHRRCAVLYGADTLFLCRECYRLPYQTQIENEHGCACIRRNKLYEKLYGESRRRMWHKTRQRLTLDYQQAREDADRTLIECWKRLVASE